MTRLEDLRCSVCLTLDSLQLDARAGVVECEECGAKARVVVETLDTGWGGR
ncbi:hypothetical protein J5X84_43415 [Streptosporangiaceae bacterium NEAU-GS5]|nr:hypothetical protein [Streptosporangiaceae bacterium NEAU-GS5]